METSSAGQHSADRTQVLLGAEQDRLKEEARKISQTVEQLREKLRKVQPSDFVCQPGSDSIIFHISATRDEVFSTTRSAENI